MKKLLIIFIILILLFFSGIIYTYTGRFVNIIQPGSMVTEASYIIFTDGTNYYARNGFTGKIDYKGNDAASIIQQAINTLTNGGKIVIMDGDFRITSPLILKNNMRLEISPGTVLKAVNNMNRLIDGRDKSNVNIEGLGKIQCNGLASIGIDFTQSTQLVTHNRVYDVKIFGATDAGLDFTNNSEFLLSGEWEINGAIEWSGPSPTIYSNYGIRVKDSGGQNNIIGGSVQACKVACLYMSGGTLKIYSGAIMSAGTASIMVEGVNPGNDLFIYGTWFENPYYNKSNIYIKGEPYSVGILELHGVQMFSEVVNVAGTGKLDYLGIYGGWIITTTGKYNVDMNINTLSALPNVYGTYNESNPMLGFIDLSKVDTTRSLVTK